MNKDRLNVYNNYIKKHSPTGFKSGLKYAACFYIGATIAGFISPLLLVFDAIDLANFLILPLYMIMTNFVAWAAIGVIFIVASGVAMSIAKPFFHLTKDLINERRAQKKENGEEKVIESQGQNAEKQLTKSTSVDGLDTISGSLPKRPKTPDRDSALGEDKDSFVTDKGWLSQSDITSIARIRYGWKAHLDRKGLKHPHQSVIFTCLGNVGSLKCELEEYKAKVERDGNLIFTSVLNINGNHWVTLVVAYNQKDKQFRAYYCDPFGNGLPKLSLIEQQKKDRTSVFEDPSALKELQECMSFTSNLFDENLIWQREKEEHVKGRLDYVRKQIDKLISKGIDNEILKEWIDSLSKLIDDLIQQRKDGVTEDLDSIKNRVHELSKKNNVISLDKDYVTCLLQQTLEISDDNVRSSNAKQQKDTWNCGIFALENAKIITDALKVGESFDEIDAKLKYTLSPEQLIEKRKEFAEALKKDEQSIVRMPSEKNRRSSVASSVSSESGISVGSKVVTFNTAGDGNCFFHSVFGEKDYAYRIDIYENGVYRAERAQEMREEWHKFLKGFESLDDCKMSNALIKQMQTVFTMFLDRPQDLTGKSDEIKRLVEQTNKKIKEADSKIKKLIEEIVKNFCDDGDFRKVIYPVIERAINQRNKRNIDSPRDQKTLLSVEDLLKEENRKRLYNDIVEDLESCALILNPNLSKREYGNTYDPNVIKDSFIDSKDVYNAYLEAISEQDYYVFAEEIPILASLAGIEITVHYKDNGDDAHKVFEPNPEIIEVFNSNTNSVEVYQRNSELWGDKEQETIYLKPGHYERAKDIPLTPPPSRTESLSSLQSVLSYCPIM